MRRYNYMTQCPNCGQTHLRTYHAGFEDLIPEPGKAVVIPGEFRCRRCKQTFSCWITIYENSEVRNRG